MFITHWDFVVSWSVSSRLIRSFSWFFCQSSVSHSFPTQAHVRTLGLPRTNWSTTVSIAQTQEVTKRTTGRLFYSWLANSDHGWTLRDYWFIYGHILHPTLALFGRPVRKGMERCSFERCAQLTVIPPSLRLNYNLFISNSPLRSPVITTVTFCPITQLKL